MTEFSGVLNVFSDGSFTITREGTDAAIAATHDDYVCSIPLSDICAASPVAASRAAGLTDKLKEG